MYNPASIRGYSFHNPFTLYSSLEIMVLYPLYPSHPSYIHIPVYIYIYIYVFNNTQEIATQSTIRCSKQIVFNNFLCSLLHQTYQVVRYWFLIKIDETINGCVVLFGFDVIYVT